MDAKRVITAIDNLNKSFNDTKNDIAKVLDFFQLELNKKQSKLDWSVVGSMVEVRKQLIETLSFMSGFSVEQIQDTLLEEKPES